MCVCVCVLKIYVVFQMHRASEPSLGLGVGDWVVVFKIYFEFRLRRASVCIAGVSFRASRREVCRWF